MYQESGGFICRQITSKTLFLSVALLYCSQISPILGSRAVSAALGFLSTARERFSWIRLITCSP